MGYSVIINGSAEQDINSVLDYIEYSLCNQAAAISLFNDLNEEIDRISQNPDIFAVIDDLVLKAAGVRFAMVGNYLLLYSFSRENRTVTIYRFLHGKRNWMSILRQSFTITD
ncbi:MAG: type II toxin-antitoxin system RelE/ParE family toxin [Spirochaetales bacterium]|nr:type II toxin-antitoxin system RelE/ParE family toxin [Spirochaetales bacterium]